jgi:AraC-like DNA-binding protein
VDVSDVDSKFEDRLEEIDLLQLKDLDALIPFFQDALQFLHQYKVVQAKGDLAEKNRMQRVIALLKELLLQAMDTIEKKVGMSEGELNTYLDKYEQFSLNEQEFLDLIRKEKNKTFHKSKSQVDPIAKMKKGKTKVKNWMRP